MNNTKIKTYTFALVGLILFSSGLCLFGESIIFKYESADAIKNCMPIWEEIEKTHFKNVGVKVIAYRGISKEYWSQENS